MTGLDASNLLYEWFSQNDTFEIEQDFVKIISITDEKERDQAAILASLNDFKEKNIVHKSNIKEKEVWVLARPYGSYPQSVDVAPQTATAMAALINTFCEVILGDESEKCDASEVKEKDIQNLLFIANHFMQNKNSKNNID